MGDENIIANVIMDFFVIVIIFIYSFIIKLDSGNNSSSGKNNSSGNNNSSGKNNSSGNNSSSNLSIFEKEYTDILKNIIKLFKTEANIFSPFLFSYLTFFFYISTISKKYNIYEYLFICLFIILIPILLVGLILFITGFFSYINSAVLDEVSNNIYIYIHCIVLFLTIYSLSYPINNLLNNNNKFTKDLLIIMIILLFVSCFSIFIIFMHENINILSMFHRNNEIFQKKKIFGIEMPIYLILYLLIIIGLYTASILVPREIIIYATTLMTLVSFLIYIFQKSNA
jgi:hypothetical protein